MDKQEQSYFEGLSGHKTTDDSWWDMWVIYHEPQWGDKWCYSEEVAQSELKRLSDKFPDEKFHIEHIKNAGYGDVCFKAWGGRMFPKERYE